MTDHSGMASVLNKTEKQPQIETAQIKADETGRKVIDRVFSDKDNFNALTDKVRQGWPDSYMKHIADRRIVCLATAVDGDIAGIYAGTHVEGNTWIVSQFVLPEYRKGFLPLKMAKKNIADAFSKFSAKLLLAFVPCTNKASLAIIKRTGFKLLCTIPGYYTINGKETDVIMCEKHKEV